MRSSPHPTTAGNPNALAKIAVWDVGPPSAVANPSTNCLSRRAVSEGVRSSANITEGICSPERSVSVCPLRIRSTLFPTSRISAARALRYSSPIISICWAKFSIPSDQAASTLSFSTLTTSATRSNNEGSSRNIACASKIAASSALASCSVFTLSAWSCSRAMSRADSKRESSAAGSAMASRLTPSSECLKI